MDNSHTKDKETYSMEFCCSNCSHRYSVKIERGRTARGYGGDCPYCGKHDYGDFPYSRPHWLIQAQGMTAYQRPQTDD